ncbi:Hypothetical protein CINCED_3A016257 [Cinara cedri]|uniref:Uncharacterized protein n=1 Tax=Cinara cedri TaxID=506608 RepID=A0A5E4M837_9HEMI|nr:Hypothetical protein CINCED_3A016257 [Cinara cedri]
MAEPKHLATAVSTAASPAGNLPLSLSTGLELISGVTLRFLASDCDLSGAFRLGTVSGDDNNDATAAVVALVGDRSECGDACCGFSGDLLSGDGPRSESPVDGTNGRSTVCCDAYVADEPLRPF